MAKRNKKSKKDKKDREKERTGPNIKKTKKKHVYPMKKASPWADPEKRRIMSNRGRKIQLWDPKQMDNMMDKVAELRRQGKEIIKSRLAEEFQIPYNTARQRIDGKVTGRGHRQGKNYGVKGGRRGKKVERRKKKVTVKEEPMEFDDDDDPDAIIILDDDNDDDPDHPTLDEDPVLEDVEEQPAITIEDYDDADGAGASGFTQDKQHDDDDIEIIEIDQDELTEEEKKHVRQVQEEADESKAKLQQLKIALDRAAEIGLQVSHLSPEGIIQAVYEVDRGIRLTRSKTSTGDSAELSLDQAEKRTYKGKGKGKGKKSKKTVNENETAEQAAKEQETVKQKEAAKRKQTTDQGKNTEQAVKGNAQEAVKGNQAVNVKQEYGTKRKIDQDDGNTPIKKVKLPTMLVQHKKTVKLTTKPAKTLKKVIKELKTGREVQNWKKIKEDILAYEISEVVEEVTTAEDVIIIEESRDSVVELLEVVIDEENQSGESDSPLDTDSEEETTEVQDKIAQFQLEFDVIKAVIEVVKAKEEDPGSADIAGSENALEVITKEGQRIKAAKIKQAEEAKAAKKILKAKKLEADKKLQAAKELLRRKQAEKKQEEREKISMQELSQLMIQCPTDKSKANVTKVIKAVRELEAIGLKMSNLLEKSNKQKQQEKEQGKETEKQEDEGKETKRKDEKIKEETEEQPVIVKKEKNVEDAGSSVIIVIDDSDEEQQTDTREEQ